MTSDAIELPCSRCGNAAVRLNLRGVLSFVPAKFLFAAKGAARLAGKSVDFSRPDLGMPVGEISSAVGALCIECSDILDWRPTYAADGVACSGPVVEFEENGVSGVSCAACRYVTSDWGAVIHAPVPPAGWVDDNQLSVNL